MPAQAVPPRVEQARRFLAQRGFTVSRPGVSPVLPVRTRAATVRPRPEASAGSAPWQPVGPAAVLSPQFGLVTGRITSIAFDPSDATGNRVYVGTTGGGVWLSQNAGTSNAAGVLFAPLTDVAGALSAAQDASISIGAMSVQPGGTGVVLAGTGDPNDALDSYYGAGILRSTDGGNTWSLIQLTSDFLYGFAGEGFAGFAWSTANPQLVVAAVSQAYEGSLSGAVRANNSYQGLYYSTDSGATWSLARLMDGGVAVQGPNDPFAQPDGNAATSVVWNPVRNLFIAAVRYHGYYQSTDGVTWTRMTAQPGTGLTTALCPANHASTGSIACPIFRGTLAVNSATGDTFAWTVDANNQDQGLWQDQCALSGSACSNTAISFGRQWDTTGLETSTLAGAKTIANGDYNLALAAAPSGQDTLLFAGANDLWKCSLANSCAWRNTTNATSCMSAQVAEYQHAVAWNAANPLEILVGNDGGLWRSTDAVGESGSACSASDATHFQNLNAGLGSLAEVVSLSQVVTSPYTLMAGLGANGTAGVKSTTGTVTQWPQILGGEGGPVAIDPTNGDNWYVNNQAGVSIHKCTQAGECGPADFGSAPVVSDADVSGDGYTMTEPAPFVVDPLDPSQLLVGTCRVWRGPADGSAWSSANAISAFLDGVSGSSACSGDALVRTLAAMALPGGSEVIYVGMYGSADGGGTRAGHVMRATLTPGSMPLWSDLTFNPVTNDTLGMNAWGFDISGITIDRHDVTGSTVYVTVEGFASTTRQARAIYRSTDGGAHWAFITSNLPQSPANAVVVDPQDANTVYLATDMGVFSTRQVANCATAASSCWAAFGTGLPLAPVVQLSASPSGVSPSVLVAGTYGRGAWMIPLWTAGETLATATVTPTSLTFASQAYGVASSAKTLTVTNTGTNALTPTAVAVTGDFSETDNCQGTTVSAGANCTIQVTFTPSQVGALTGQLTISANIADGALTVALSGTGEAPGVIQLSPTAVSFGQVQVNSTSSALPVTVQNNSGAAVAVSSIAVSGPFVLATNACGTSIAANSSCALGLKFAPTGTGSATGTLTLVDGVGTQTVALTGTGAGAPTDAVSPSSLAFAGTIVGQTSAAQTVTLTNNGGEPLTSIAATASGPFQIASGCAGELAANSSCSIGVSFTPTAAAAQSGTLTVSDALGTHTVSLSGTGLSAPVISMSAANLQFAVQTLGAASAPQTLTVSNTGGAPMANVGFQISGAASSSFRVSSTTCGATLNNGSSCTAQVVFTPTTAGANPATLTVSSSTLAVTPAQVGLSGTGVSATGINISPAQMTFSVAAVGQASAAQTATITNAGATTASGLTLNAAAPFAVTASTCGATLAAQSSCVAAVTFTPTANGTVTGAFTATTANAGSANVALSGSTGGAGALQVSPTLLNFSTTGVGAVSAAQTVTLTNSGTVALTSLLFAISNGFEATANTCPASLAVGASCTVSVAFNPTSAGVQTGALSITSSALALSQQVVLSGTGFDFTVAVSGSTSQTVASGQTANFTLVLTPLSGSSGTFSFTCGTVPAHSACSFNPSSATVNANMTGNVTVQVATGGASAASHEPVGLPWRAAPLFCGILLLPLGLAKKRRALQMIALLAILVGGAASCSGAGGGTGGSGSGGSGSNTPAGTYSIVVTATANGVSHQATVSLTVD